MPFNLFLYAIVCKALAMRWIVTKQIEDARLCLPLEIHSLVEPSNDIFTQVQMGVGSRFPTSFQSRQEGGDFLQVVPGSDTCPARTPFDNSVDQ